MVRWWSLDGNGDGGAVMPRGGDDVDFGVMVVVVKMMMSVVVRWPW